MQHQGYFAAVISKRAAKSLRPLAVHPGVHCHHITLAYKPDEAVYRKYESLIGKKIAFTIGRIYADEKGQAAPVKGLLSENKRPHLTLSCAEGVAPVYSNTLLETARRGYKRHRQRGFATVRFVAFPAKPSTAP